MDKWEGADKKLEKLWLEYTMPDKIIFIFGETKRLFHECLDKAEKIGYKRAMEDVILLQKQLKEIREVNNER